MALMLTRGVTGHEGGAHNMVVSTTQTVLIWELLRSTRSKVMRKVPLLVRTM